jgi:dolichol-phosphate mannosyltransferase
VSRALRRLLTPLVLAQAILGARVLLRFVATANGERIPACDEVPPGSERVAVVVPVLDEDDRLASCLDGLLAQGPEVAQILVVDGGSVDGTPDLVARYSARDARVRLVDASPTPDDWNGKAWNLYVGVERAGAEAVWILTVDADVRPAPLLVRSLLAHARRTGLAAFSVATRHEVSGVGEALHPALLTTLVYRFGLPGGATSSVRGVQANGQCFLVRREVLSGSRALSVARASRCEDVTIARHLASLGWMVGFYEAGDLAWVTMYANGRELWRNWPRSLPLRDQYAGVAGSIGLAEVALAQALPLPLSAVLLSLSARSRQGRSAGSAKERLGIAGIRPRSQAVLPRWLLLVNVALVLARLGVLLGTARAYRCVRWPYWLSPLCDVPAAVALCCSGLRRRHTWRGRVLVRGGIR